MKKWIWVIALLFSTVCFAGERNMIRNFDKNGLKDLNNQLKKQEKLIQKLTKQLQDGGTITSKKTVQTQEDFVSETVLEGASTTVDSIPAVGIARDDGRIELYTNEDENDIINIEPSSYVHETQAKIAVPSSYFLDLRGATNGAHQFTITADLLILHDTSGNTLTLSSINETNDNSSAGAGGRDQALAFTTESWIYVFIIYNPITQDVSSLTSASATAPTLPTGYTFFVRVSAGYVNVSGHYPRYYQRNDKIYVQIANNVLFMDTAPAVADTWESISLAAAAPPTAKSVTGYMGTSVSNAGYKGIGIASDSGGGVANFATIVSGSDDILGAVTPLFFDLPIETSQTLWWKASTTDAIYALYLTSFTDDL